MRFGTGYWGIPGTTRYTMVHISLNGKPFCGTSLSKKMEYQFCADYVVDHYVECERCRKKYKRHMENVNIQKLEEKTRLEVSTAYVIRFETLCPQCNDLHKVDIPGTLPETFDCPTCGIKFALMLFEYACQWPARRCRR